MNKFTYVSLLFSLWLSLSSIQLFAQNTNPSVALAATPNSSCEQVVEPDSAYGFVRILERDNSKLDFMQVNVEVEFQVADHEPCTLTETTPVELYLPKAPISLKVSRQEGQNPFHFSIHRKRLGPIMFLKDINSICMAYDEEWRQSTWC